MATRDPRIDAYIAKSADFARPILTHLRKVVHQHCRDAEETVKWNVPFFMYQGQMLASMAAFKAHCGFNSFAQKAPGAKGTQERIGALRGIKSVADLPTDKILAAMIKAATLPEESVPAKKPPRKPTKKKARGK